MSCQQEVQTGFHIANESELVKRECVFSFNCLSVRVLTLLVGYGVSPSEEAPPSPHLLPVRPLYVPNSSQSLPSHLHRHPPTSSQHKDSVASQDSEQLAVQQPPSRSLLLPLLVHHRNQQMLQPSQNLHPMPPKRSHPSLDPLPPQAQSQWYHPPRRQSRMRPATQTRSR